MRTRARRFAVAACWIGCLLLPSFGWSAADGVAPTFVVRTSDGKDVKGVITRLDGEWKLELGKLESLKATGWLALRQQGVAIPALPADEHLVLSRSDRIPFRRLRLDDEKLRFQHPDLEGNKDVFINLSSVAMVWRGAPEATVQPAALRHRLLLGQRKRDLVLLVNGDRLEGTLNGLSGEQVEMEVARKNVTTRYSQIAAVLLNTDLSDKGAPRQAHGRVVLTATDQSPGGRFTVISPTWDGKTFQARTRFGATLRVPVERIALLELATEQAEFLSALTPGKYKYMTYLDESWKWTKDTNVRGGDLLLGGSTYDRGIGQHADSQITYTLDGKYRRFDSLVGLDDREGRKGRVQIRILLDGKPADLGKTHWTNRDGGVRVSISVEQVKEMTLEVIAPAGPVQAVVNWVEARLVR